MTTRMTSEAPPNSKFSKYSTSEAAPIADIVWRITSEAPPSGKLLTLA